MAKMEYKWESKHYYKTLRELRGAECKLPRYLEGFQTTFELLSQIQEQKDALLRSQLKSLKRSPEKFQDQFNKMTHEMMKLEQKLQELSASRQSSEATSSTSK